MGRDVIGEFTHCFNFLVFILLRESFWDDSFNKACLHSDSVLVGLMDVYSESACIGMKGDNSSDTDVFLETRNQDFQFLESV